MFLFNTNLLFLQILFKYFHKSGVRVKVAEAEGVWLGSLLILFVLEDEYKIGI